MITQAHHNVALYLVAGIALVVGGYSLVARPPTHAVTIAARGAPVVKSRSAWTALTQGQTISLGEALSPLKNPNGAETVIHCSNVDCQDLAASIDDALQIAGWPEDVDHEPLMDSSPGISVGADGLDKDAVASFVDVLSRSVGVTIAVVESGQRDGKVHVYIGKKPK